MRLTASSSLSLLGLLCLLAGSALAYIDNYDNEIHLYQEAPWSESGIALFLNTATLQNLTEDEWALAIVNAQKESRQLALEERLKRLEGQRSQLLMQRRIWQTYETKARIANVPTGCDLQCSSACFRNASEYDSIIKIFSTCLAKECKCFKHYDLKAIKLNKKSKKH